ncbi:MAG: hypothetical protein V4469_04205 [Patescibacteria group bacterium]
MKKLEKIALGSGIAVTICAIVFVLYATQVGIAAMFLSKTHVAAMISFFCFFLSSELSERLNGGGKVSTQQKYSLIYWVIAITMVIVIITATAVPWAFWLDVTTDKRVMIAIVAFMINVGTPILLTEGLVWVIKKQQPAS